MKLLLELIGDACHLLTGLEQLSDLRPDSQDRLQALLHQLRYESTRLLDQRPQNGASFSDVPVSETGALATENNADDPNATLKQREVLLQAALEALAKERYEQAGAILLEAITHFPTDDEFYSYLGLIAWELHDLRGAERYYAQAASLIFADSDFSAFSAAKLEEPARTRGLRAIEGRALCLYKLGELDQALPLFEFLGMKCGDEYTGCRYLAGEIYHHQGQLDRAIERYAMVALEPAVLYNLGLAYFEQDDLEKAATSFVQAFVSNVHIASLLLGRYIYRAGCVPGYLGSEAYAEEFVDACIVLWRKTPAVFSYLQRCFDHNMVQNHLQQCALQIDNNPLGSLEGLSEQEGWLNTLHNSSMLLMLAQHILQRLDA